MIPQQTLFQHQLGHVWPTIWHEKLLIQNVTNITFIFETSPNTKPKKKKVKVGGRTRPVWKSGEDTFPCPHQIAAMGAVMCPSHFCRVRVKSPSSQSHLNFFESSQSQDLVESSHKNCRVTSSHRFPSSSQCRVTRKYTFFVRHFLQ